jgi:hypothetical protein
MCFTAHLFPTTEAVRASDRGTVSKCHRTAGIALGVATGCELDVRVIGVQSPAQSSPIHGTGGSLPRGKAGGVSTDSLPPSSAKVKSTWRYYLH